MSEGDAPAKKAVEPSSISPSRRRAIPRRAGQAAGGARHRAPVDLCVDHAGAEGPHYVRVEKNRFFAEESGRLVTAFLERFFERYVEL
jgi:hypothetical protein